ncbi:hypothetical protein AB5I41_25275 [Sphingomonas sp. MMS24-JH45]
MLDRLVESLRLASFRNYLAVTVNSMSALVSAIVELASSDVVSALQRIRPCARWPSRLHPSRPSIHNWRRTGAAQYEPPAPRVGDAVLADGLSESVEVAVAGASLDVVLRSDASELSTHDGMALLKLGPLPEIALQACAGRAVDDVVDHPVLRGRGYVVDRAVSIRSRSMLTFEVGRSTAACCLGYRSGGNVAGMQPSILVQQTASEFASGMAYTMSVDGCPAIPR